MDKIITSQMLPPMGPPAGGAPPENTQPRPIISGPLKSIGEILYDFNIEKYIALHPDKESAEIANDVWEAYGGESGGASKRNKTGKRKEEDAQNPPEVSQKEIEDTEDSKWERLLLGQDISDITSLDEITGLMKSLEYGMIKKFKAAPAAPPGGGMPPLASVNDRMEKTAFVNSLKEELKFLKKYMSSRK